LEYVPGGSIGSCLLKHGAFDKDVTKSFISQVLSISTPRVFSIRYLRNLIAEETGSSIMPRTDDDDDTTKSSYSRFSPSGGIVGQGVRIGVVQVGQSESIYSSDWI
jgi:hypothetical protein